MAYKILEQNGIDNENIDGAAFNNFSAGNRDGIIKDVLNECALSSTGNIISVAAGEMILHGFRVKITAPETLSAASAPAARTEYQIVAQVTLSDNHAVAFTLFFQLPQALIQNPMFDTDLGTYQAELGRFYQETDGVISGLRRTLPVIYADSERYAEEAKAAAEQAQAAAEEAQEGATQSMLDIPLSPEQTGVAITGENTLNNAKVTVQAGSKNLFTTAYKSYSQSGVYTADGTNSFTWTSSKSGVVAEVEFTFTPKAGRYTISFNATCVNSPDSSLRPNEFLAFEDGELTGIYKMGGDQTAQSHSYTFTKKTDGSSLRLSFYASVFLASLSNYSMKIENVQLEIGEVATEYTPYVTDGTAVNITACGRNLLSIPTSETKVQHALTVTANTDGSYDGVLSENADNWSCIFNIVPFALKAGKTYYLHARNNVETINSAINLLDEKNVTITSWAFSPLNRIVGFSVPEDKVVYKIGIFCNNMQTPISFTVQPSVELTDEITDYAPYTGATYPATVGQSVEIVQYDKITNVFTDNSGVTVSAAFKQSTRYELDDRLVPLFGAFASRPTDIQPFARLYVATDQTGDNKVTILPANTDGSVSENWITI